MTDSPITKKTEVPGSIARRILIIVVLLLVIPLALQSFFLYRQEYEQKLRDVEEDLQILADERAHFINETLQMDWQLLEETPPGESCSVPRNVKRLYIEKIPLPPGAKGRFVAISSSREALLAGLAVSDTAALVIPVPFAAIGKDLPRAYQVQIALIGANGKVFWENQELKEKDALVTKSPIGDTGLSIQLTVDKGEIHGLYLQSYYLRFATLVFFVGVIGGGAVFLFTRRVSRPLRNLNKVMQRVSAGAAHARYKPDWMGFEINALGVQFNQTLDALLEHAQEAEKERLHRERLAKELSIGHEIQESLLPKNVPGLPDLEIASRYIAATEVNGDFYELFKMPNGDLLIAVCDIAGKGISACLFALGLRSILRSLASVGMDLAELVRKANDLYSIDAYEASMFATLWIGVYHPKNQTLTYCSQGHLPALVVRGAQLEELWTAGIAMGAQKMDVIPVQKFQLAKGDLLVLHTDGIIEAHNPERELFKKTRFYDLLVSQQKKPVQQIADRVIEEVQIFARNAPQHDDMTLLAIRIIH